MPFHAILHQILTIPEVRGVVFLDSEGETIAALGRMEDEKLRLIAAYQAILMNSIGRLGVPADSAVVTQCEERTLLTQHLKDGYLLCIVLDHDLNFARAQFLFRDLYSSLISHL